MDADELESQVIDLQARIAYQEHTLLELDRVIAEQAERIVRIESRLVRLLERLDAGGDAPAGDVLDERPPHY